MLVVSKELVFNKKVPLTTTLSFTVFFVPSLHCGVMIDDTVIITLEADFETSQHTLHPSKPFEVSKHDPRASHFFFVQSSPLTFSLHSLGYDLHLQLEPKTSQAGLLWSLVL